ncbi:DNA-binding transcriptional regulator DhaR [compost metagenome]
MEDDLHSFAGMPCESMQENFQRWLLQAIEQCDGNLTTVAKRHGVSRSTLYRKVREFEIDVNDFRSKRRGESISL